MRRMNKEQENSQGKEEGDREVDNPKRPHWKIREKPMALKFKGQGDGNEVDERMKQDCWAMAQYEKGKDPGSTKEEALKRMRYDQEEAERQEDIDILTDEYYKEAFDWHVSRIIEAERLWGSSEEKEGEGRIPAEEEVA